MQDSKELIKAVFANNIEKVKEILTTASAEYINTTLEGRTSTLYGKMAPLHVAAYKGHIEILKLLIQNPKTNLNVKTSGPTLEFNALQIAARNSQFEACKVLLPVCDFADDKNIAAYFLAKKSMEEHKNSQESIKDKAIVELLLVPTFGEACGSGNIWRVKRLVEEEGVDINAKYGNDWGLKAACLNRHMDVIDYLLSLPQLDLTLTTQKGATILHLVSIEIPKDKITPLPLQDCSFSEPSQRYMIIEKLIKRGADPNTRCKENGSTPLYLATISNLLDAVKALVANGADLTLRYIENTTKLAESATHEELEESHKRVRYFIEDDPELREKFKHLLAIEGGLDVDLVNYFREQKILDRDIFSIAEFKPEILSYLKLAKKFGVGRAGEFRAACENLGERLKFRLSRSNSQEENDDQNVLSYFQL